MTDKLRAAAEMALEALKTAQNNLAPDYEWAEESGEGQVWATYDDAIHALRQALDQLPDTTKMIDTGIDRGAWSDVPDATKWVDELRGDEESPNSTTDFVEDEPVAWNEGYPACPYAKEWFIAETSYGDRVVLKSLPEEYAYDFTTADGTYLKKEKVTRWMQFPDSEYVPFSQAKRKLTDVVKPIGEIQIEEMGRPFNAGKVVLHFYGEPPPVGTKLYAEPPNSTTDVVEPEPFGWLFKQADGNLYKLLRGEDAEWSEKNNPYWVKVSPLYTAPPKREWVGLTDEEIAECIQMGEGGFVKLLATYRAIEAKLKEKNYGR